MPTYCYRRADTEELVELEMSIAEHELAEREGCITLSDGTLGTRDWRAEHTKTRGTGDRAYPILSDAMGVHPDQVPAAREHARAHGVPTDFTPDGRPVIRSRKHRKQYGESRGFVDRNGCCGDPMPQNR